jgi:hypothetical protein
MAHITIEYIILLPVLLLQILLFPLAVSWLMNIWVDSRRTLALQETASYIGSNIQQVYSILNHTTVQVGVLKQKLDVPPFIEGYPYTGNATLKPVLDPALNSSKVLEITLRLSTVGTTVKTMIILGQNANWTESTFVSNSTNAHIIAEKKNETITLYFGPFGG